MITNKQKILLCLIKELSELDSSSRFMIIKCLFLLKKEVDIEAKFYNFFPYMHGPFSNSCFHDLNYLHTNGLIEDETHPKITEKANMIIKSIDSNTAQKIQNISRRFNSDKEIKQYVYETYPEYTVKSLKNTNNSKSTSGLFTIGYEGKDIDLFLDLLIKHNINLLIDVRKNPFSMNFSFTKKKLSEYLRKVDIGYLHIPELGIEGSKRKNLNSKEDYIRLFEEYRNTVLAKNAQSLNTILKLGKEKRIAMMCFEQDRQMCHRGVISDYLASDNVSFTHL